MGEDKALLPFAGYKSLAEYQYSRLTKIFSTVYISCKDKSKFDFEANFIEDEKESLIFAPTVGFISIYKQLPKERFFVLSVDAPFVETDIIQELVDADQPTYDATIASLHEKMQPLCGIYHPSLLQHFQEMLQKKKHKLGVLLKNANTHFVAFNDAKAFMNINDKNEYNKALKIISYNDKNQ